MTEELTPEQAEILARLQSDPEFAKQFVVSNIEKAAVAVSDSGDARAEVHFHAETIRLVFPSAGISEDESRVLADYLGDSAREWQKLPLAGIDPEHTNVESLAGQPRLSEVYVELHLRERKSDYQAILRHLKTGEVEALFVPDREEPWPALDACGQYRRLVILGDPGSGKSTFLRMMAYHLASGFREKNAASDDKSALPFPDPLVPILINLRDFAAADIGDHKPAMRLARFIRKQLEDDGHGAAHPLLERLWRDRQAVLFLDGLDEIARSERRDYVLASIRGFAGKHPDTRIVVTCRIAAYEHLEADDDPKTDWRLPVEDFPPVTLAPFTRGQQRRFIRRWYHELKRRRRITGDPDRKTESLCRALERSHIARLAPNPLILTVMTIVHADRGELPHERVKLYAEAVDTLLRRWRQGRDIGDDDGDDDSGSIASILAEVKRNVGQLEPRLWKLAWEIHGKTPETGDGDKDRDDDPVADIPYGDLVEHLRGLHPDGCREWTAGLIEAIKHRSGLLIERKRGVFTFPHRTFQEYLAARELVRHPNFVAEASDRLEAKTKLWREVVLLAAGSFAHQQGNPAPVFPLLRTLLEPGDAADVGPASAWVTAADLICEMTPQNVGDSEEGKAILTDLTGKLLTGMHEPGWLLPSRFACGSALGRLGDPRQSVTDLEVRGPEFWSTEIPPDPFPMGTDEAPYDDEKPRIDCALIEHPYAVSRFPVTVAQYDHFVEAGGYRKSADRFWAPAGRAWKAEREITGPEIHAEVFQTPNHPQVGVSWFEAAAFCAWLAEESGLPIRLPTEPEWERAARHTDAREYPWGEIASGSSITAFANTFENGIHQTSAAGLFENGRAECGADDLAGNVWEWTGSLWTENYRRYETEHRADPQAKGSRVLRGGAWLSNRDNARCAFRGGDAPYLRSGNLGFRLCVSPFSASGL